MTVEVKILTHANIGACPFLIMVPEHYRANGTCRCDDHTHDEMREWGYVWDGRRWHA